VNEEYTVFRPLSSGAVAQCWRWRQVLPNRTPLDGVGLLVFA